MLDKQRLDGPTLQEWAATALSPETARAARQAVDVREDGSVVFDLTAPAKVLSELALFVARLGFPVQYRAPRIEAEKLWDALDDVLEFVRENQQPVDVDIDGDVVHIRPGPAPVEHLDPVQLAARLKRLER